MGLQSGYGASAKSALGPSLDTGGGGGGPSFKLPSLAQPKAEQPAAPGRFQFDFTDPVKSTFGIAGEAGRVVGTLPFANQIGKDIGKIGELGPEGFKVKDIVGSIGNIAGSVLSVLSIPEQMLEAANAKHRIEYQLQHGSQATAFGEITNAVPEEILKRARAGESLDDLAKEMASNFQGWSSNTSLQLAGAVVADPLNLVSFGAGAVADAGKLVRAGVEMNSLQRVTGTAYNALTAGAGAAGKAVVKATLGPATSGVIRAYGAGKYGALLGRIGSESPELRAAAERALGINHTQLMRAVIGKVFGKQYSPVLREAITPDQIEQGISTLLTNLRKSGTISKQIEDDAAALTRAVKPKYIGMTDAQVYEESLKKLSATLAVPPEVAARILGSKVSRDTAAIIDGMFYGKAVDDFAPLRDIILPSKAGVQPLQAERLTPIAHTTLTDKRVEQLLDDAVGTNVEARLGGRGLEDVTNETYDMDAIHEAVERYDVLKDRFLGTPYTAKDVVDYVRKLKAGDGLVEELTSGLPRAAKEWTEKYGEYGYSLGYAPKSGWKAIVDEAGDMTITDPFVHVQAEVTRGTIRNPIGRFGDSLFGAIHQRQLVLTTENRLGESLVRKSVGSEAQARAIARTILRESADRQITPRAMATIPAKNPKQYANRLQEVFGEHLSTEQYQSLIKKTSPEFEYFRAIAGKLSEVGWTQKLTGSVKAGEVKAFGSTWLTKVSEGLYPNAKFRYNPFFQTQERFETTFWKVVRGVAHKDMDPEVRQAIIDIFEHDPDFRFLSEDFGAIFLHKGGAAAADITAKSGIRAKLAGAKANVFNVAGTKRDAAIQQVFTEYAPMVEKSIIEIDPKLWQRMAEAAGSTDAHEVVASWIKERQALSNGGKGLADLIQKAYDENRIAEGQRLQRLAGAARNGTAESGGAIRAAGVEWDADMETIWQAWRYGLERSSQVARQTQYFREGRGWLERSLNHPFLGLYPLSYASKVFVEFGRFLLKRPFGLNAPLLGLEAMNKFQRAVLTEVSADDSELGKFVEKNPVLVNYLNQMLPYWPTNVTVNAPLWVKDIASQAEAGQRVPEGQRTLKGQNVTVKDIGRAVNDQANLYLNPLRLLSQTIPGITEEFANDLFPSGAEQEPNPLTPYRQ